MKSTSILYLALLLLISSCDEIFERDITSSKLELIAPTDNLVTKKSTLTFWWNELSDADSYRLQVVSISFDTILSNPVDTILTTSKFEVTLNPGRYSWRVKAMNSGTETAWFTRKLTILFSSDISDQEVQLNSPKDNSIYSKGKIKFQWTNLPNATQYMLIVKLKSNGNLAFPAEITVNDTLTKVLDEGVYSWGVKGMNENSMSLAENKTFTVDLTPPDPPTLQLPAKDSIITGSSVILKWAQPADNLTSVYDSLYISKDDKFTQILQSKKITTTTQNFSSTDKGKFYWRVKAIDAVGNKSSFSEYYYFTFQ